MSLPYSVAITHSTYPRSAFKDNEQVTTSRVTWILSKYIRPGRVTVPVGPYPNAYQGKQTAKVERKDNRNTSGLSSIGLILFRYWFFI
jgi:hypothetical protein